MSRKTRRSRRRPVLVLVTLLLAVGAFAFWTRSGDPAPAATGEPTPTSESPAPEPAPSDDEATEPTEPEAVDEADDADDAEAAEEDSGGITTETSAEGPSSRPAPTAASPEPQREASGLTPVAVSLTYAGWDASTGAVVGGGFAADVVEQDATCTLILRRDGVELRGESLGTPSATTTDCGEVRVGGTALASGTWEAVLGYTSETSAGQSAAVEVEVP